MYKGVGVRFADFISTFIGYLKTGGGGQLERWGGGYAQPPPDPTLICMVHDTVYT